MVGDPTKDEYSDTSSGVEATRRRSAELFAALRNDSAPESTRDEAREGLVHLHLPLVEHCARRFRNRGEPFEDLVQVGTIGLLKSIDRFDLERGVEFSTYATPTIIGEIKRYFRDKGWAIRVPAPAAGAAHADRRDQRRADPEPGPLPHGARARGGDRLLGRGGPGRDRVEQRLLDAVPRRQRRRRRRRGDHARRHRRPGREPRARRDPGVDQAPARPARGHGRSGSCCCASSRT